MTGCRWNLLIGLWLGLVSLPGHALPPPLEPRSNGKTQETGGLSAQIAEPSKGSTPTLHIMIDPGHGGVDKGATRGAIRESEIALKVSLRLAELLRESGASFRVSLTRTRDEKLSLAKRTSLAQEAKADLFLSIHLNSSKDLRAQGKEFYFQNQLPVDEETMFLASRENDNETTSAIESNSKDGGISAKTDLKRILDDLHRNERIFLSNELSQILLETWMSHPGRERKSGSRAIRQAPFFVVSNVTIPSVLVELGFITNPNEGPLLAQQDYQEELAQSLYKGLLRYKETIDKDGGGI